MKQQLAALNQQAQAHAGQPMAAQYHVQAQFVAQQVLLSSIPGWSSGFALQASRPCPAVSLAPYNRRKPCTSRQSAFLGLPDVCNVALGGPSCMPARMWLRWPQAKVTRLLHPAGAAPDNCHGGAAPVHTAGGPAAAAASCTAAAWAAAARVSPRRVLRDASRAAAGPTPSGGRLA